jgi:hypothetical protein
MARRQTARRVNQKRSRSHLTPLRPGSHDPAQAVENFMYSVQRPAPDHREVAFEQRETVAERKKRTGEGGPAQAGKADNQTLKHWRSKWKENRNSTS